MKKLLITSSVLLLPTSVFADYYDPVDYGLGALAIIIEVALAVLGIVLFFKIWGMTNNVKYIKSIITSRAILRDEAIFRKYRILEQNDKAADLLIDQFIKAMEGYIISDYYTPNQSIVGDISLLERRLTALNKTIPSELKRLKTAADYKNLGWTTIE